MKITEVALQIPCVGDVLIGVLAAPAEGAIGQTGVVIVVGGPQVRAGSHRQFTLLARYLAAQGYPVLRFDVRGMGDSGGEPRSFHELDDDIGAAIQALCRSLPNVRRVVLWGLCDGASAALLYLSSTADSRIAGLCLINPWVRSDISLARTHVKHYYMHRLLQVEFWRKLLGGRLGYRALSDLLLNLRTAKAWPAADLGNQHSFQRRMARAWSAFDGPILLLLSGNDYTAKEFVEHTNSDPLWCANLAKPMTKRICLDGADHTFSSSRDGRRVEAATLDWLNAAPALAGQVQMPTGLQAVNPTERA